MAHKFKEVQFSWKVLFWAWNKHRISLMTFFANELELVISLMKEIHSTCRSAVESMQQIFYRLIREDFESKGPFFMFRPSNQDQKGLLDTNKLHSSGLRNII